MDTRKTFEIDVVINAPKEKVWTKIYNEFAQVNDFNPLIQNSFQTGGKVGEVGCERQCDLSDESSVIERITAVRGTESFDIEITEGGLPMMSSLGATMEAEALAENQTKVKLIGRYMTKPKFMANMMKNKLAKTFGQVLIGLKYHLETGELVTSENKGEILKLHKQLKGTQAFSPLGEREIVS